MKHKILFLLVLLIIPIYVRADSININCPSEVNSNTEFSCEITGTTNNGVTDVSFKLDLSSSLSFVTFVKGSGWNGEGDLSGIDLYGGDVFNNNFKIGVLKVKSTNTNGIINLRNVFFYNNSNIIEVNDISKTINIKATTNNNNNSNNSNNNNNNNNSNKGNNNVEKKSSTNSNIVNPNSGSNSNENNNNNNNNIEEYEVDFDNGAYLSNLKIKGYDIDFRKDIFNYNLKIGNEEKLDITPSVDNNEITYEIVGNSNLKDGSQIYIEVKYKDDIQTYYINISKEDKKISFAPIFISIIVILILFNIFRILFKRKNNNLEGK